MNKLIESVKSTPKTQRSSLDLGERKRINTDLLIAKYPNGITITDCALFHDKDKDDYYGVVVFKESNTEFYSGGYELTATIKKWFEAFGQEEVHKMLQDTENPVVIKVSKQLNKKGKTYNHIDYVC